MKSERMGFAERLNAALTAAGISDSPVELMKLVARFGGNVSQQGVSNWLHGKNMPRQQNLRALAKLLRMDVANLQYGREEGGKVRDERGDLKIAVLDQHAIDAFLALPESKRAVVRGLIDELSQYVRKTDRVG